MVHEKSFLSGPAIDSDELKARDYAYALRGVGRLESLILIVYPFLLVFLVAFFIDNLFVLIAILSIYWVMFYYLETKRYSVDVKMRDINPDFRTYVIHSPFSQKYFKFSVIAMLIFFGEIIGVYVRMTAYEAAAFIIVILSIMVAAIYTEPWLKGQIRHSRELDSDYINTKLRELSNREKIPFATPKVVDGKTFNVANAYTVGIFRPVVCITDYAIENMSEDESVAILAHELSHFKRKDVLRMAIPVLSASVAIVVMVVIVAFWSTQPNMIPFLQNIMPRMVESWVVLAMVGFIFLPSFIRLRGEFKADRFAVDYSGADLTIEALVKLQHLNRLPVYVFSTKRTSLLVRIHRIRNYQK